MGVFRIFSVAWENRLEWPFDRGRHIFDGGLTKYQTQVVGVISPFLPNDDIHWGFLWYGCCGGRTRMFVRLLALRFTVFSVRTLVGVVVDPTYVTLHWPPRPCEYHWSICGVNITVFTSVISYKGHQTIGGNGDRYYITLPGDFQFVGIYECLGLLVLYHPERVVKLIHGRSISVEI